MASNPQTEMILADAITGIPRVAKKIAEIPTEFRESALEAAERSYSQTLRDLGYAEPDAQVWISAVMFRLLSQVAEHQEAGAIGSEPQITKYGKDRPRMKITH
jgi:hypothetical protein